MTLPEKVSQVTELFRELDAEIAAFQKSTTLHCQWGCGKCCFKPDIEATILEFLPFALSLFHAGEAEQWLSDPDWSKQEVCRILNATQTGAGLCSCYEHRGLICRLFGYSARTNKYAQKQLLTCQIIKTGQQEAYEDAEARIQTDLPVPLMSEYYMRLRSIDPLLTEELYPINEALRKALETVLWYHAYRTDD